MEMDKLGYDLEWQNFNSKYYTPQNRERIYTIGHLRAKGAAKILPITPTDGKNSICEVKLIGHRENYRRNMQVFDSDGITEALDTATCGGRGHHVAVKCEPKINYIANYSSGNQRSGIMSTDGISRCLFATDHKQPPSVAVNVNSVVIPVLTPERAVKRQNGRRFKDNGDESFTLTAQDRHGVAIEIRTTEDGFHQFRNDKKRSSIQGTHVTYPTGKTHALSTTHIPMTLEKINICEDEEHQGYYVELEDGCVVYAMWYEKYQCYITIRKLTPKECFRLQGWSDEYFERAALFNSDSQLYKQAGNGVTVNVVYEIGKAILRRGEE